MSVKLKYRPSTNAEKAGTLVYQVIHGRVIKRIKSGYKIYNDEWNDQLNAIILPPQKSSRYNVLNQIVHDTKWEINRLSEIEVTLVKTGGDVSASDIVEEFVKDADDDSVFKFAQKQVERLMQLGRVRSSEMLRTTMNRFVEFRNGVDISFSKLNAEIMVCFEAHLKGRCLKRNTIGFYMRTLRALYNIAVDNGVTEDTRPFRRVYTGKDKTVKRALCTKDVQAIMALDLSSKPHLAFARDMFMFSLYARGMSFVDMAYLRKKDKDDKHFTYCRRKTGQQLSVEWIPEMQKILDWYDENTTPYLLPIITRIDKPERRQYLNKIENINHALKEVARLAKINVGLTMYWARHTWSTLARNMNIPISVISEALGHDSEKTTQIYLDSIQTSVVDKANRAVIKELFKC